MSGGFLSRFRFRRNAEGSPAGPAEEPGNPRPPDDAMPDKVATPDLDAEGNDVAMESMELSHEGLDLDEETDASSTKLAQYAINGNSPGDGDSLPGALQESRPESDETAGVDVKYTMFKADGTPVAADGDAPDFQDALITETTLPKLDAADPPPDGPDGLAADGQDGSGEYNSFEAWPNKWYVPELDSDSSAVPPIPPDDPEEMTTLEPIAEAKETTGSIPILAADLKTELFDDDGDPDPDDLI